jgi:phosphoribosylglycinamide formyltransferase 1
VQAAVPVRPGDSEETLAARVLREEHRIYPQAIRWFCQGRLALAADGKTIVQSARAPENVLVSPVVEG